MKSMSEEPVPLHEEFIYCCGAATHVLKCGPWKDLSKDESKNLPRLLFMIIPVSVAKFPLTLNEEGICLLRTDGSLCLKQLGCRTCSGAQPHLTMTS